jgi:hypothetical protein
MSETDKYRNNIIANCDYWKNTTQVTYIAELSSYVVLILVVGTWLNWTNKNKFHLSHQYHRNQVNKYIFWLILSLVIKLCQLRTMFDNSVIIIAIQPISELLVVTLFSAFKEDEDCFACYNKCENIE